MLSLNMFLLQKQHGDKSNIKICGLLGYYTVSCGHYLLTFWDNVSVPASRVKSPSRKESL
jgi:hypothetical protein